MADPFLSEIRMLPYLFAPEDWAYCEGQIYPIQQNPALYSLLGITWGGDGRSTFGLPDMLGRAPMGDGTGPGLTPRSQGEFGGYSLVQLVTSQMPAHDHTATMIMSAGITDNPETLYPGVARNDVTDAVMAYTADTGNNVNMAPEIISIAGASDGHENTQPWLAINFCICTDGYYPPRS